jgi:hypothetical protein
MTQSAWKYSRRHPACVTCEREFDEGEAHYSLLRVSEQAELQRLDLCDRCWPDRLVEDGGELAVEGRAVEGRAVEGSAVENSLWWRARRRAQGRRGLAVDLEALEAVFLQLAGHGGERHRQLRYVLCLLLMRKRRLLLDRATVGPEGELLLVRRPRRKEQLPVAVYDLPADRLDEIRSSLQRLFEGEGLEDLGARAPEGDGAAAVEPGPDPSSAGEEPTPTLDGPTPTRDGPTPDP